ncbi:hypothetical protein BDA96_10G193600 [Sorghum bicolor]|uniref:Uncharacterized protein n=1 Tax=Sorghum bicolor TaxID=4558 RepID=A0A921Q5C7_SORBI|nr:hypothetical protein BDA96_10G193600 [Sorghum bicolor]
MPAVPCDGHGGGVRRWLCDDGGARFPRRHQHPLSVAVNRVVAVPSPGGSNGDRVSMILERHFFRGAC